MNMQFIHEDRDNTTDDHDESDINMYHYSYSSSSKEETTCSGNASGTEQPDHTDLFSPSTCNVTLHLEQYVEMH